MRNRFRWWWIPTLLLVPFHLLIAVQNVFEDSFSADATWRMTAIAVFSVAAVLAAVGPFVRERSRTLSTTCVVLAALPTLGFTWFAPIPLVGLLVVVGVVVDHVRSARAGRELSPSAS